MNNKHFWLNILIIIITFLLGITLGCSTCKTPKTNEQKIPKTLEQIKIEAKERCYTVNIQKPHYLENCNDI
jgi:hypothetical protein